MTDHRFATPVPARPADLDSRASALREALSERTAVIASHRISAIRDASWIVVLDDGRIVEQGRHEDLLALGGRYWSLLRRQQLVESLEGAA